MDMSHFVTKPFNYFELSPSFILNYHKPKLFLLMLNQIYEIKITFYLTIFGSDLKFYSKHI